MQTKLSTKGQVVLPSRIRNKLGLRPGDPLDASVEGDRIVLTPRKKKGGRKMRIIKDPITGFPVLSAGPNAPILTHKEVKELLADFP
jgi:AbrB family looped-hinge helix DNA binding protein